VYPGPFGWPGIDGLTIRTPVLPGRCGAQAANPLFLRRGPWGRSGGVGGILPGGPAYAAGPLTKSEYCESFAVSPYERESAAVFADLRFMFCRAATGARDENLKARALAGAGKLKEERKTRTHRERTRSILELSGTRRTIAL